MVTCVRLYFAAAPEAGLAQTHSMCGNGDVSIGAALRLKQVCIVLCTIQHISVYSCCQSAMANLQH